MGRISRISLDSAGRPITSRKIDAEAVEGLCRSGYAAASRMAGPLGHLEAEVKENLKTKIPRLTDWWAGVSLCAEFSNSHK